MWIRLFKTRWMSCVIMDDLMKWLILNLIAWLFLKQITLWNCLNHLCCLFYHFHEGFQDAAILFTVFDRYCTKSFCVAMWSWHWLDLEFCHQLYHRLVNSKFWHCHAVFLQFYWPLLNFFHKHSKYSGLK